LVPLGGHCFNSDCDTVCFDDLKDLCKIVQSITSLHKVKTYKSKLRSHSC